MPSKTPKQRRFMAAAANNPSFARKAGIPQSVAQEYHAADKKAGGGLAMAVEPRRMFMGGSNMMRDLLEYSGEVTEARKTGQPFRDDRRLKDKTRRKLASEGWTLAQGKWWPPEGLPGYLAEGEARPPGMVGGYYVPRAPDPSRLQPENLLPGSLAYDMYQKYGIVDPTWTSYDLTPQERMQEDPLAHLDPDDPARHEYERWDPSLITPREETEPREPVSFYPPPSAIRQENPYRTQLREHKARIEDILNPEGSARGGRVEYQQGGLASMVGMRDRLRQMQRQRPQQQRSRVPTGSPGMGGRMRQGVPMGGMPGGLGMMRGNDMRRPTPQMLQQLRQRRGGRSPMGQVTTTPMRGPMKQIGPAGGGRAQIGGPGGMPGGMPPEMINRAARMPGGQAAPYRGMLQKLQAQQRMTPGGNRVGMRDQQGGLHRAMQAQTGRPPISRRAAFPGSRQHMF